MLATAKVYFSFLPLNYLSAISSILLKLEVYCFLPVTVFWYLTVCLFC